jgi:putative FmdB family regulatory protein
MLPIEDAIMPTYEFHCQSCGQSIECTVHVDEYDKLKERGVECPKCKGKDVVPQIAHFEVKTSRKAS